MLYFINSFPHHPPPRIEIIFELYRCLGPLISTSVYRLFANPHGVYWFPAVLGIHSLLPTLDELISEFLNYLVDDGGRHPSFWQHSLH
jgi:hypothetical protein